MSAHQNLLLEIIQASAANQTDRVKALALEHADDARRQGDVDVADAIADAYASRRDLPVGLYRLEARKGLSDLDLPENVKVSVGDFLYEQRKADVLKRHKMEPRHKMMLIGPPGNGKTVLAGAVSRELDCPSYMVRYDDLISSVPGVTSKNLNILFNYAKQQHCLLFFDEFDALGRERGDAQETGEMKRVTSTLLVQIDSIPSHVVCMAATNHAQMLDAAIWRRFNVRLELPRPRLDQFEEFMHQYAAQRGFPMRGVPGEADVDLEITAYRSQFENFSDAELYVSNVIRAFVLSEGGLTMATSAKAELDKWTSGQRKVI